jgi:DNA repair exonuclease SbcCD nuclease subunit
MTIRFAHISDTHLGYRTAGRPEPETGRNQRTADVDRAFTRTIDDILQQSVDFVIHSGDVFHHARPTWQSMRHFIRQMRRLEQANIPTLVIAGNHDTPRVRTGGSAYSVLELALPDIIFACDYESVEIDTPLDHLGLRVQAIPHGALTNPDPPIVSKPVPKKFNLVTTHGIAPGALPDGHLSEPGEQQLPSNLVAFSDVDYFALGHIHLCDQVAARAWYAGSTERFGWGDEQAKPGYRLVELSSPGEIPEVTHRSIATRPMIRLKPEDATGRSARELADAILHQAAKLSDPSAMARVTLMSAERSVRREVQAVLRRESAPLVWSLDLAPERQSFVSHGAVRETDDTPMDLHTLFAEFVAARRPTYPTEAFATALLERGNRALTDALLAGDTPLPEDDSVT